MAINLGRTIPFNDGSQDALLRSVKSAQFNYKHSGKVDDNAINEILKAVSETYEANNNYQLELTSKNNDALTDKIKAIISEVQQDNTQQITTLTEYLNNIVETQKSQSQNLQQSLKDDFKDIVSNNEKQSDEKIEKNSDVAVLDQLKALQTSTWAKLSILDSVQNSINSIQGGLNTAFNSVKETLGKLNPVNAMKNMAKNISEKIGEFAEKINPINAIKNVAGSMLAGIKKLGQSLNLLRLFKKKKKPTKDEIRLSKMIDKVNNFIDNFVNKMHDYANIFLNKFLSSAKTVVSKLMTHIFAWLLVNVVLIGLLIGIVLKLIAKPLMEILQPIMDFVENIIGKVLDFLAPVRDFLLDKFGKIFDSVLEPFLRGIGTVAESLGRALGKLIIAIADFFADTLLPFLKDKLLPVFGAILDIIKEFFEAIKPWIKPLVDIILGTLKVVLDGIKSIVTTLVNLIVDIVNILAPVAKEFFGLLADVFMTVIKTLGVILWPFKLIVNALASVQENVDKAIKFASEELPKLWEDIKNLAPIVFEKVKTWLSEKIDWIKTKFEEVWKLITDLAPIVFEKVKTWLSEKIDWIKTKFEEVWNYVKELPMKIFEKIKNIFGSVGKFVGNTIGKVGGLVKGFFGKKDEQTNQSVSIDQPNVNINSTDISELSENTNTQQIDAIKDLQIKTTTIINFLQQFSNNTIENFENILEKLNEKPNIVPLPMLDGGMNPTILENN